jgi:hypothetical protein
VVKLWKPVRRGGARCKDPRAVESARLRRLGISSTKFLGRDARVGKGCVFERAKLLRCCCCYCCCCYWVGVRGNGRGGAGGAAPQNTLFPARARVRVHCADIVNGTRVRIQCDEGVFRVLLELLASQLEHLPGGAEVMPESIVRVLYCMERVLTARAVFAATLDTSALLEFLRHACIMRDDRAMRASLTVLALCVEWAGSAVKDPDGDLKLEKAVRRRLQQSPIARKAAVLKLGGTLFAHQVIVETFDFCHSRTDAATADVLVRLAFGLVGGPHAVTAPVDVTAYVVRLLRVDRLPLLLEWSRSPSIRLRIATCDLLIAIALASTPDEVAMMQTSAREWGAVLWHAQFALAPDAMLAAAAAAAAAGGDGAAVEVPGGPQPIDDAREASRALLECLCWHCNESKETVLRMLPASFQEMLDGHGGTTRKPAWVHVCAVPESAQERAAQEAHIRVRCRRIAHTRAPRLTSIANASVATAHMVWT